VHIVWLKWNVLLLRSCTRIAEQDAKMPTMRKVAVGEDVVWKAEEIPNDGVICAPIALCPDESN